MKFLEKIELTRNNFKNWLILDLMFKFSKSNQLKVVLRSGKIQILWRNQFWAIFLLSQKGIEVEKALDDVLHDRIPYEGSNPVIHGWIQENGRNNGNIFDVFIYEDYRFLKNVKDKVVIDIGTSIADSAIYFALNGATKVIGLEPYPYSFNLAVVNVNENNLTERITLMNAGYGQDGETLVNENLKSNDQMDLRAFSSGKKIRVYSLLSIMKMYNIDTCAVKMDCEGCEYSLLDEPEVVFDHIEMMQIEYHYGPDRLVKKLRNVGFAVKYTLPEERFNPYAVNSKMKVGYIYASNLRRIEQEGNGSNSHGQFPSNLI